MKDGVQEAGGLTTKERLEKEDLLSKYEYIRLCIGSDTLNLKENKAELHSLFEAWHSGSKPESEYAPGELMTYEDFQLKVFLLASQIYRLEEILSKAPDIYETEWEDYLKSHDA